MECLRKWVMCRVSSQFVVLHYTWYTLASHRFYTRHTYALYPSWQCCVLPPSLSISLSHCRCVCVFMLLSLSLCLSLSPFVSRPYLFLTVSIPLFLFLTPFSLCQSAHKENICQDLLAFQKSVDSSPNKFRFCYIVISLQKRNHHFQLMNSKQNERR